MDRHDRFRARRDLRLKPGFVQVEGIRPHVNENRFRPAQDEGVDRRDKSERGDDDFVAWPDVEQDGAHLQGVGAGGGQQGFGDAELLFKQGMALFRERAVAGDVAVGDGFSHVFHLAPHRDRTVEVNAK